MQAANDVLMEAQRCHMAGDFGRAEYLYCKLIGHAEDHPVPHFMLGTLYAQVHAHGRAITFLKRAIELQPETSNGAMENLAAVYREMENAEKARYWGTRALAISRTPIALSNMAGTFINDANPEEALKWAEEAIATKPLPQALNHKALALLELGRFEEAWKVYDARLDLPQFAKRPYDCPKWDGGKVGKLAIHGEQGLGDEILFLTCLAQLAGRIGEVAIEVNPRLVKLIQNSFPAAKVFGTHEELIAAFVPDAHVAVGSLPQFGWPVKRNAYLKPTAEYPRAKRHSRVGLSWRGGTVSTHMPLRNAPIDLWKTFLDWNCISLQYGDEADNAAILNIPHDAESIADLDRLAAMIRSCDLVITVCNTTVHLAGALGVPCLVLVPAKPAWRYGLSGTEMIWYESPYLLRQEQGESWERVFERAKDKAKEMLGAHQRVLPRAEQAVA